MDNAVLKALCERRSIKKYKPELITKDELDAVLTAATYAPNGMGKQSPVMVVVQEKALRDKLSRMNAEIMNVSSDPFYGAPTVVVVFGNPDIPTWLEDASLTAGNLLNAAHAVGIGGCWIHRARQMFESPEGRQLMRQWGIPENMVGVANCILGYPDGDPKPRASRKDDYIVYA
ncbi:MAG: nitroreductase [Bacteroidales bacterium]|jgi:nitroreductase|nr:nitroreductase [Bacteroidales bacterium]